MAEPNTGAAGRVCRRCLLEELGQGDYLESVRRYRARLPEKERTPDDVRRACQRDVQSLRLLR